MINPIFANTIYSGIDNAFNWWASKVNEKDAKKKNAKVKAIYDSYNETFNGSGAQGEWGLHLPENEFSEQVLMPLAMDAGKSLLYREGVLLANGLQNWFSKKNKDESDVAHAEIPEGQTDIEKGGLKELPIAAAGFENSDVKNNMAMTVKTNPTNMSFSEYLLKGLHLTPDQASKSAYAAMININKKGSKLIPRQK